MATLLQHVMNIKKLAYAFGGNSDDASLDNRQIEFWIQGYRAKGVAELTNFGKDIDPQLVQDLGILKLQVVDKTDSTCPVAPWGCTIKKVVLPKFVALPKQRGVVFVGLIDKQTPLVLDDADTHIFSRETRFGHLLNRCYLIGQTLYVVMRDNDRQIKYINVRGVFEDPLKIQTTPAEGCDAVCFNAFTDEYPMPMNMYDYIVKNIISSELNMGLKTNDDELNNAREENGKVGP